MKSLFLLVVCIVMVLLLREAPKKQQLERIDIVNSHVLEFSGTMFLPKNIQADHQEVNSSFIKLSIAGKNYQYVKCYNSFCLVGAAREVPVYIGDKVTTSFPTKLFFARNVK